MRHPAQKKNHGASFQDTPLCEIIFQTLTKNPSQRMRFDQFMELALYHPQHGYYSSSFETKIGRSGDFFTSVSVGATFGGLLSHAIEKKWREKQPTEPLVIVEQGGHDGQLAFDILQSFKTRNSPLSDHLRYFLIEPRDLLRQQLSEKAHSTGYGDALYPVESPAQVASRRGIFLCNELLDAFAVRRFCWSSGAWNEVYVAPGFRDPLEISLEAVPCDDPGLVEFLGDWPQENFAELEDGYTTEFCPGLGPWVTEISRLFEEEGSWWIIDYGWEAPQYFDPRRTRGTLRCYHRHQVQENPLLHPGEADITAHVNFSALVRWARKAGLKLCQNTDQGRFLTEASREWLLSLEGKALNEVESARIRQFKTLTCPSMMGAKFRVHQFGREVSTPSAT